MSDIRETCPVNNCPAQTDSHVGCWDKSCPRYLAYQQGMDDMLKNALLENGKYCWQECWSTEMCNECDKLVNGYCNYFENGESYV